VRRKLEKRDGKETNNYALKTGQIDLNDVLDVQKSGNAKTPKQMLIYGTRS
jgi:hypothetical protein